LRCFYAGVLGTRHRACLDGPQWPRARRCCRWPAPSSGLGSALPGSPFGRGRSHGRLRPDAPRPCWMLRVSPLHPSIVQIATGACWSTRWSRPGARSTRLSARLEARRGPISRATPRRRGSFATLRGRLRFCAGGRLGEALDDFRAAGEIANRTLALSPCYLPWRSDAALVEACSW